MNDMSLECGNPSPENGIVDVKYGTSYDSNVTISCKEGYTLTGPSVLYCLHTGWNDAATCVMQGT